MIEFHKGKQEEVPRRYQNDPGWEHSRFQEFGQIRERVEDLDAVVTDQDLENIHRVIDDSIAQVHGSNALTPGDSIFEASNFILDLYVLYHDADRKMKETR